VAVHFSTPLRLYQPYACATDTDGEGQKNGQKLTHQSGEEPYLCSFFNITQGQHLAIILCDYKNPFESISFIA
ncbi:hypothetical protein, partial [Thiolapillus sp.]|uniref:hypothetical protein n=1 Tax=Thiolapillus sp. TaxID=2017437 RepID=UPI003AF51DB2